MISHKEQIFLQIIENFSLNESFSFKNNALDLLLEAPIDDTTVQDIIDNKKRVSLYYQGDSKNPKGWMSSEVVKTASKNGKNYILVYHFPKDGSKPELKYIEQEKIVNWNVLGKKDAEKAKEYNAKVFKFFVDPKIPSDKKDEYKEKLKKVGSSTWSKVKKAILYSTLIGSMFAGGAKINQMVQRDIHAKGFYEFATLRSKTFTENEMSKGDMNALRQMIEFGMKNKKAFTRGDNSFDFVSISNAMNKKQGDKDQVDFSNKKDFGGGHIGAKSPYTKVALLLGNAKVTKTEDGYVVNDKYDFNQYRDNPQAYSLANFPKKSTEIIKYFGNGNVIKGFEEIGNYYHALGYDGYKVQINVPK